MERYETAVIEIEQFDEDVITASIVRCEMTGTCMADNLWTIYYSDGSEEYTSWDSTEKYPGCP